MRPSDPGPGMSLCGPLLSRAPHLGPGSGCCMALGGRCRLGLRLGGVWFLNVTPSSCS